ncbi:MAG: barnase inhibitor [Runella slithyformis]|nr:MAG: barnase inhibitor [Runella slithyformis]
MPNFIVFNSESDLTAFKSYHLARIDGAQSATLKDFFAQIEKELQLPDYFSHNLDSLDELLNDLERKKKPDVALVVSRFEQFLANEKKKTKLLDLLGLLDATAEDWKWLDEEDGLPKKNLKILLQNSPQTIGTLESEGIGYEVINSILE